MPRPLALRVALVMTIVLPLGLSGCGGNNPVLTPVGWWHDLQGGAIAADRPPPPGADLPYPKIYTIPPKPVLPSASYRETVETQLAQERDDTERLAAHSPIVVQPAPPPPPPAPAAGSAAGAAPAAEPAAANATIPAADAPPPAPPSAAAPAAAPDGGPAPGTPVTIAGLPGDESNLPSVPDAPPPPATFEGIPAEPAPTPPPPLPAHLAPAAQGKPVFFKPGDAVLDSSQAPTVKDAASHRGKGTIEVEGHGDARSDTPAGQEAALDLGLKRAQVIAKALEAQHVPPDAIRISATAFGRGASLHVAP
jgi:outer membrane protein OmpA-like peptidoglycan-associated protein